MKPHGITIFIAVLLVGAGIGEGCGSSFRDDPLADAGPPADGPAEGRDRSAPPIDRTTPHADASRDGGSGDQQIGGCASSGCPAGHYCDLGSGSCLPGCASAAQCGGNPCNVITHACCKRGEVVCGSACVRTDSDPAHCGGCDEPCPIDEPLCSGGTCSSGCAATAEDTHAACSDGCSNDGDKYVDCDDYDCCAVRSDCPQGTVCAKPPPSCDLGPEDTPARCADGCSNDGDKYVDCDDYDCCAIRSDCPAGTACGDQ